MAGKDVSENGCVFRRIAAGQGLGYGIRHAEGRRVDFEPARLCTTLHQHRIGDRGGGDLVHAVAPVHDQGPFDAQAAEGAGHQFQLAGIVDAQDLELGSRRIGQRPEQIEHGAHPQFAAGGGGMLHGRVMAGCEQKADANRIDAVRHRIGRNVQAHAERLEHVGAAGAGGDGPVAVLGHRLAAGGDDDGHGGGDVEGVHARGSGAAGTAGIEQVTGVRVDGGGSGAHGAGGACHDFGRFAADGQAHQQGAGLCRRRLASHDGREHLLRLALAQRRASLDHAQGVLHGRAHARNCRKLASILWPCSVRMDSGWNCTPKLGCS